MTKCKEVECKNCKYYSAITHTESSSEYVKITKYCDPEKTMKSYGFLGLDVSFDRNDLIQCFQYNSDNDCKYYKRKWWKFWVKEGIK